MAEGKIKTVIIGLDGATYDLIDPLVKEGIMPNLGRIMEQGARAVLHSTIHPLTPPAWATLMTGRTPGNHGVFDFIGRNPKTYLPNCSSPQQSRHRRRRSYHRLLGNNRPFEDTRLKHPRSKPRGIQKVTG